LNYGTKLCSDFKLILNKCEISKKLAKIAKIVLSVPATQFESERNFSISGRTLEDRRSSLSHENVDKLLFIKSQLKDK